MTHEKAIALSQDLAAEGIVHTIEVGVYADMSPSVQCRVDLRIPRRYVGGLAAAVVKLEEIAAAHELVLHSALMGDGLSFSTLTDAERVRSVVG